MISLAEALLILIIIISLAYLTRKVKQQRGRIKERVNREFNQGIELSTDELENRLGELELMYENLEETYWAHIGVLVGISTYLYWHVWYVSIAIGVGLILIGCKFLSIRPFITGVADIEDEE